MEVSWENQAWTHARSLMWHGIGRKRALTNAKVYLQSTQVKSGLGLATQNYLMDEQEKIDATQDRAEKSQP